MPEYKNRMVYSFVAKDKLFRDKGLPVNHGVSLALPLIAPHP